MLVSLAILIVLGLLLLTLIICGCLIVLQIASLAKANFVFRTVVVINAHHN